MPSLFVETPATTATPIQLVFPWDEENVTSEYQPASRRFEAASESVPDVDEIQPFSPFAAEESERGKPRLAEPMRIGGVMIKLLKRYGITDEEIAAGLANYANKHTSSMAS